MPSCDTAWTQRSTWKEFSSFAALLQERWPRKRVLLQCFPQLLDQCCEHPRTVSRCRCPATPQKHPAAAAALPAATFAGTVWEQYVAQASVSKITGKKQSFHLVVRSHVQCSQVVPCCVLWLHAILFAKMMMPYSWAFPRRIQLSAFLRMLPPCFAVNFSGFRVIVTRCSFLFDTPWVENFVQNTVCLVSRPSRPATRWVLHSIWMSNCMNILDGIQTPSNWDVWKRDPESLVQSFLLLCVLEWIECTNNLLHEKSENTWNLVLLLRFQMKLIRSLSMKLLPSITSEFDSELPIQEFPMNCSICSLFLANFRVVPIFWQISRLGFPTCIHNWIHRRSGPPKLFYE